MAGPTDQAPQTAEEFEDFLRAHYDRIFRQAYRMLGNKHDAEDLAQDIAMSLPKKLQSFAGQSSLSTWLYRVVNNAAVDKLRQSTRVRNNKAIWADFEKITEQEVIADETQSDWLWMAIRKLDNSLSSTAFLLYDEGLSQAEAADILGISQGTVSWRVSEIKKSLKSIAKKEELI